MNNARPSAKWPRIVTWTLCWLAFTLTLAAWRLVHLPIASAEAPVMVATETSEGESLVAIDANHHLHSRGKTYATLAQWSLDASVPPGGSVIVEVDPDARAVAVERVARWLQSRGVRRIVVRVASGQASSRQETGTDE